MTRVPLLLLVAAGAPACTPGGDVVGTPSGSGGTSAGSGGQGGQSSGGSGGPTGSGGAIDAGGEDLATPGSGGSGGGASGSGGSGGATGTGGAVGTDGGGTGGGSGGMIGGSDGGAGGAITLPPLTPCTMPAVSRLKVWEMMTSGGSMMPMGSPLRKVAGTDAYEMYVSFTIQGGGYGTANTALKNAGQYANGANPAQNAVDISAEGGITLEYATTGASYLQIRTGTVPHGGAHFKIDLPVTAGMIKTTKFNFADFRRPGGQVPPGPDVLKDAFSLTFVASATGTMTLRQVRVGAFVPPCN